MNPLNEDAFDTLVSKRL